ncbi:MAG TPA: DUF2007 domain-containing protein [Candidatus Binatia bacterium]|nr:DUF2007 domain-containing protein [Candidatus Binatia bacterium]
MASHLYLAADPVEAQIVRDYLAAHGIGVSVRGQFTWGALGEIPFAETYPRLHLEDERDRERALDLLRDYGSQATRDERACPDCGERSPGNFPACWNCSRAFAS